MRNSFPKRLFFTNKMDTEKQPLSEFVFFNGKHLIYQHQIGLLIGTLNNYCQGNVEKENQFLVLLKLNLKVKLNLSTAALVLFSVPQ